MLPTGWWPLTADWLAARLACSAAGAPLADGNLKLQTALRNLRAHLPVCVCRR